jgi:hypothetical protein
MYPDLGCSTGTMPVTSWNCNCPDDATSQETALSQLELQLAVWHNADSLA